MKTPKGIRIHPEEDMTACGKSTDSKMGCGLMRSTEAQWFLADGVSGAQRSTESARPSL